MDGCAVANSVGIVTAWAVAHRRATGDWCGHRRHPSSGRGALVLVKVV